MARVTVEDCLRNVRNRFELVLIAAKRARQLMRGGTPKVAWDNDKPTVVALREIAEGYTDFHVPTQDERDAQDMLDSINAASEAKNKEAAQEATLENIAEQAIAPQTEQPAAEAQPTAETITEQPAENTAAPTEEAKPETQEAAPATDEQEPEASPEPDPSNNEQATDEDKPSDQQ